MKLIPWSKCQVILSKCTPDLSVRWQRHLCFHTTIPMQNNTFLEVTLTLTTP